MKIQLVKVKFLLDVSRISDFKLELDQDFYY